MSPGLPARLASLAHFFRAPYFCLTKEPGPRLIYQRLVVGFRSHAVPRLPRLFRKRAFSEELPGVCGGRGGGAREHGRFQLENRGTKKNHIREQGNKNKTFWGTKRSEREG